jgi:hypothetical protein
MKKNIGLILLSVLISSAAIFVVFKKTESVNAQFQIPTIPGASFLPNFRTTMTSPQISVVYPCRNGIAFAITPTAVSSASQVSNKPPPEIIADQAAIGLHFFPVFNMVPIPQLGLGYYQWWSLRPGAIVLGKRFKTPVKAACTIYTCCKDIVTGVYIPSDYTVLQVGTNKKSVAI